MEDDLKYEWLSGYQQGWADCLANLKDRIERDLEGDVPSQAASEAAWEQHS